MYVLYHSLIIVVVINRHIIIHYSLSCLIIIIFIALITSIAIVIIIITIIIIIIIIIIISFKLVSLTLILWIVIYPVNGAIQVLNNRALDGSWRPPPPKKKKLNKYTWAIICLDILRFVIHRHLFMIQ